VLRHGPVVLWEATMPRRSSLFLGARLTASAERVGRTRRVLAGVPGWCRGARPVSGTQAILASTAAAMQSNTEKATVVLQYLFGAVDSERALRKVATRTHTCLAKSGKQPIFEGNKLDLSAVPSAALSKEVRI
jgi:hypothetical protein